MAGVTPDTSPAVTQTSPPPDTDGVGGVFAGLACPVCGYDLAGITGTVCPECGGELHPEKIRRRQRSWHDIGTGAWLTTLTVPIASFGLLWLSALVARVQLGHWPRPSLDDPARIDGVFLPAFASLFAFMLSIFAFVPSFVFMLMMIARAWKLRRGALIVTAFIIAWAPMFVQAAFDPGRITQWVMD